MSLEDYLKQNIKAEVLQKTNEFKSSSTYKAIVDYSSSKKYQTAKMQLKLRDKNVHRTTLSDIQRLQEQVLIG
jgi:hypothetical protein